MPEILSWRPGDINQSALQKGQNELLLYTIDFAGAIGSTTVGITTATVSAVGSTGATATTLICGTTAISGTQVNQTTKTGGAGGTGAANIGDRFQVTNTVTLANGEVAVYQAYIYISGSTTYGP